MNKPQPTDSLFTSINQFDAQVRGFLPGAPEGLIEACVRHMVKTDGAFHTSVRLQRLADICGGVNVMPIEHWNQKAEQQTQPEPAPVKKEPRYLLRAASLSAFGLGWLCSTIFYIAMETLRLAL